VTRILATKGLGSSKSILCWLLFVIFLGPSAVRTTAAENFWGCLIFASNSGQCNHLPERLSDYDARMHSAFGYSRFCLVAEQQMALQMQKETGLVFSNDLKIVLAGLTGVPDGKFLIKLLFYDGSDEPVMETQARVSRGSPLFIRGPNWRDGQIIIVVMLCA
jgi:hypothetical protein